jgi:RNA polymerase sigma-70 factor (ECF subfamily)
MKALEKLDSFEPRREGAFFAYLRTIMMNRVYDESRRVQRRVRDEKVPDDLQSKEPSPLENLLGVETLRRYEAAIAKLPEKTREAVVLRLEFGFTYAQIAEAIDAPSANATRMLVSRAVANIAALMRED